MEENVTKRIHPVCEAPCGQLAQIDSSPDAPASGGMAACGGRGGGRGGRAVRSPAGLYQVPLEPRLNHAADDGGVGEQDDSQALRPVSRSACQRRRGHRTHQQPQRARLGPTARRKHRLGLRGKTGSNHAPTSRKLPRSSPAARTSAPPCSPASRHARSPAPKIRSETWQLTLARNKAIGTQKAVPPRIQTAS